MNRQRWIVGLTVVGGLAIGAIAQLASHAPTLNSTLPASSPTAVASAPQAFADPIAPAASQLQPLPVPNLIPQTTAAERLPQVSSGRSDPFAALDVQPIVVPKAITAAATGSSPGVPTTMPTTIELPTAPGTGLSSWPQPISTAVPMVPLLQPAPADLSQLPLNPPLRVLPQDLAQAIEISGVVQTGSKTSIIVKVPDEASSRYVSVGDYLANGRILVKRVEMNTEPVVILEQDGKEISRFVGGAINSSAAGLL